MVWVPCCHLESLISHGTCSCLWTKAACLAERFELLLRSSLHNKHTFFKKKDINSNQWKKRNTYFNDDALPPKKLHINCLTFCGTITKYDNNNKKEIGHEILYHDGWAKELNSWFALSKEAYTRVETFIVTHDKWGYCKVIVWASVTVNLLLL